MATEAVRGPFTGVTLSEVAASLRSGADDPVALVERALAAAERAQPVYHAFARLDPDRARADAQRARDELTKGTDRGPLHGVPVAVKDIVDTAGLETAMGSRQFAGNVPDRDAAVVARLRIAGAIVLGKTVTQEFAYGPTGDVSADGPVGNPHDPTRMSGGSSAGSAVAVAAGLVPLAVGTDTGGSVRIPAALCGIAGLRPTLGRVPTTGVFPLAWSLDTVGPLAAGPADLVLGWAAFTGEPGSVPESPPVRALRVGLVTGAHFARVEDGVAAAVAELAERLAKQGATVREVPVPDGEELAELYRVAQSGEAVAIHRERLDRSPERFEPETLDRLRTAEQVPAWQYARALRRLAEVRAGAAHRLTDLDLLLLPTVPVPAPPIGTRAGEVGGGWSHAREALLAFTSPWSALGLPGVSLPVPSSGRLPVGAQLIGAPGADGELLAAAGTVARVSTMDS